MLCHEFFSSLSRRCDSIGNFVPGDSLCCSIVSPFKVSGWWRGSKNPLAPHENVPSATTVLGIVTLKLPFKENSKQTIDLTWCRSSCSCPSSYTKCYRHINIIERIQHHHMRMPSLVTSQYKFRSMVARCFSSCFLHAPPLRLHCSADRLCAFFSSSTSTTSKKRNFYIFPSLSSFLFMQRDGTIN